MTKRGTSLRAFEFLLPGISKQIEGNLWSKIGFFKFFSINILHLRLRKTAKIEIP
jgi:hypothetical protein